MSDLVVSIVCGETPENVVMSKSSKAYAISEGANLMLEVSVYGANSQRGEAIYLFPDSDEPNALNIDRKSVV